MTELVAVTGASGFIGSHLVEELLASGFSVRALAHYNSCGSICLPSEFAEHDRLEVVHGDIRDASFVREFVKDTRCCFHLAALVGVPYSFKAPVSYFQTNAEGTLNVLEAIRANPHTRLVFASTSDVFGNNPDIPIGVNARLLPSSPYAASKCAAERFVYAYAKSFDLDAIVVRPFNTFGPRQSLRAVIPVVLQQAIEGDEIVLGAPDTRRDFLFVKDLCRFYEMLVSVNKVCEPVFNVGSGTDYSIRDVVEATGRILGRALAIRTENRRLRPPQAEVQRLLCDNSVATDLGWQPASNLEDGLALTLDWITKNPRKEDYAT